MATRDAFYREARTDLAGPLEGVRVLDVTTTVAGPRCSCVLADYGAEVIKIEIRDPGDVARRLPPTLPGTDPPDSYLHATINRNKKNISLDLRRPRGRDILHRLVQDTDILVENFKQGTLAGWGCGYEQVRKTRPDIVYVSITGFGQYGPYSERPGYDPVAQAMSGFMQLNAASDEAIPMKAPVFLADEIAGLHGVMAALAALQHRNRTGEGQHVDVSLLDSMIDSSTGLLSLAAQGVPTPRLGNTYTFAAPANAYQCRDGSMHFWFSTHTGDGFAACWGDRSSQTIRTMRLSRPGWKRGRRSTRCCRTGAVREPATKSSRVSRRSSSPPDLSCLQPRRLEILTLYIGRPFSRSPGSRVEPID